MEIVQGNEWLTVQTYAITESIHHILLTLNLCRTWGFFLKNILALDHLNFGLSGHGDCLNTFWGDEVGALGVNDGIQFLLEWKFLNWRFSHWLLLLNIAQIWKYISRIISVLIFSGRTAGWEGHWAGSFPALTTLSAFLSASLFHFRILARHLNRILHLRHDDDTVVASGR